MFGKHQHKKEKEPCVYKYVQKIFNLFAELKFNPNSKPQNFLLSFLLLTFELLQAFN